MVWELAPAVIVGVLVRTLRLALVKAELIVRNLPSKEPWSLSVAETGTGVKVLRPVPGSDAVRESKNRPVS